MHTLAEAKEIHHAQDWTPRSIEYESMLMRHALCFAHLLATRVQDLVCCEEVVPDQRSQFAFSKCLASTELASNHVAYLVGMLAGRQSSRVGCW